MGIPRNSGIARTDSGSGILGIASSLIQFRNCWELIAPISEFNGIELDGIPESVELIPDPELLTDIQSHPHPHICYMQPIPLSDSGSGIGRH